VEEECIAYLWIDRYLLNPVSRSAVNASIGCSLVNSQLVREYVIADRTARFENYSRGSRGGGTRDKLAWICVLGVEEVKPGRCVSQWWAFPNDALCCITHPSYTSNVGPTARTFSRYVDVVASGPCSVSHQTDVRPRVELVNNLQDRVYLSISCTGNGSVSVHVIICNGKDSDCAAL
jgi:hypothetical protein